MKKKVDVPGEGKKVKNRLRLTALPAACILICSTRNIPVNKRKH